MMAEKVETCRKVFNINEFENTTLRSLLVTLSKNVKIKIYRNIILPVVLYGCESWSLTLREESRLRVFENEVLRKIFGPKRDEVTGEWRGLHNKELYALYSSPSIIRVIKSRRQMGRTCGTYRGEERCIQGFIGET
jgi:hypothetical protein